MDSLTQDQQARQLALNPERSFIVQAPAGSGKTELLIQRYLTLLSTVNEPEEILAITFTRKAAGEMRERILEMLTKASSHQAPGTSHQPITYQLAQQALQQNDRQQWELLHHSHRLRIMTIDAFVAYLNRQIPYLSEAGALLPVAEDAFPHYEAAVRELFLETNLAEKEQTIIKQLLLLLDNRYSALEKLSIYLLSTREQWLGYLIPHWNQPSSLKQALEKSLHHIAMDALETLQHQLTTSQWAELHALAKYACGQFKKMGISHPLAEKDFSIFPTFHSSALKAWQALSELILTQANGKRATVTKANGFPSEEKIYKARMLSFLEGLSEEAIGAFVEIKQCPPVEYTDSEWELLASLMYFLPRLAARLKTIFIEAKETDYTEQTLRALEALGHLESPTELALQLDYNIHHIMIDEFQDTSVIQYRLFERLIQHWDSTVRKTLFIVGDPMQSIYRFRHAEVGLFLKVCQEGFGSVALEQLSLTINFRSERLLIDWINRMFSSMFPKHPDIANGAIPYLPALVLREKKETPIYYYPTVPNETLSTEDAVVQSIQSLREKYPQDSIAILVQSRHQLQTIMPALRKASIAFHGIDLESLYDRPEIQDCLTLCHALLQWENKMAWLALLRAPWCGLKLADLLAISQHCGDFIWPMLKEYKKIPSLSSEALIRLAWIVPILVEAFHHQTDFPFYEWIKKIWGALRGPETLRSESARRNVSVFFECLVSIPEPIHLEQLERVIQKQPAESGSLSAFAIQIMTIHKAKGLEFDHVLLPGLSRMPLSDTKPLLQWMERPRKNADTDLLLAPLMLNRSHSLYSYIQLLQKKKSEFEFTRLMYVACTRAKKSLHLFSEMEMDDNHYLKQPPSNSFMHQIWTLDQSILQQRVEEMPKASSQSPIARPTKLFYRLAFPENPAIVSSLEEC